MIIAIDFDGTIVTHDYPRIGQPVQGALEVMHDLQEAGHKLILWTMRSGQTLDDAVRYLMLENGIMPFGINFNPTQGEWTESPKAYAHIYIDDAALGCPLIHREGERPWVDWHGVRKMLVEKGALKK